METNERKVFGPYIPSILNNKISLSILEVGKNLKQNLEKKIQNSIEGKCIPEGYIRPGSVKILTYSSGNVNNEMIDYQVTFECETCYPPEGHLLECIAKTITKAGKEALYLFCETSYDPTNKKSNKHINPAQLSLPLQFS